MPSSPRLLFFAGSARTDSINKKLARAATGIADANGIAATFLELADYPMPLYNGDLEAAEGVPENARKLHALLSAHSGIFIASPEYNAGITPLLKNTLDWISRVRIEGEAPLQVYKTRVFMIASASPGNFGGIRGLTGLRHILEVGLGALVLPDQIAIPHAGEAFDHDGKLHDIAHLGRLKTLIQKLSSISAALYAED